MQPRGGPPPPAGPAQPHPSRGAHMQPHPAAHAPHAPMAPHLQPMHRDARMLAGHMTHAGSASIPMGMNYNSHGLRMRHCPPPSQPPMSVLQQPYPHPPPSMHKPPPIHHHIQHSQIPTQMPTAPQRLPITTSSVCPSSGMISMPSQPIPVTKSGVVYAQKSSPPPVEEKATKVECGTILAEPSNNVSSSKEKTPMCLVNELARYNKIQHQYRLTSEQGPAHRRRFTVALRLGGGDKDRLEEYTAEAPRIRAAQHAVAAEALRCTNFPLPPPRPPKALRNQRTGGSDIIMPTVELNALAMKLGEPATYKIESQPTQLLQPVRNTSGFTMASRPRISQPTMIGANQIIPTTHGHPSMHVPNFNRNGRFYNQSSRYAYPYKFANNGYRENILPENLFRVELTVGKRVFHGKGITLQAARHDAAARALQDLRQAEKEGSTEEKDSSIPDNEGDDKSGDEDKSPVSMVHEIALKLELPAAFSVKNEKGPPHMKVFTTTCTVGEFASEGEGNSKKISKKRAAENMLDKLKKLPSYQAQPKTQKPKRKAQPPKKKNRNLIKEKGEVAGVSEQNPVSRLLQWANNKNSGGGVEPTYTLKEETRGQYRHSFIIHCDVAGRQTTGTGTNKKVAKRNAAENMLIELGLGKTIPATTASKSAPADAASAEKHDSLKSPRKVTFSLEAQAKQQANSDSSSTGNTTGRQLVPGVLLMQDHLASVGGHFKTPTKNGVNIQTTATIAKELLRAGTSPTAEALVKQDQHLAMNANSKPISSSVVSSTTGGSVGSSQISQVVRPKDQLLYLAQLLGFQVQFSDFPKGNHGEFLSLVTLSTEPPMLCHGGGLTTEESHDQSARAALEQLSQMGLDNVTPHQPVTSSHGTEGIRMLNSSSGSISGILTNGISK